jgi:conjugal transfer pilus assembly protein TraD
MPDQITRNPGGDDVGMALTWLMLIAAFGCLAALCTGPAVVGSLMLVALTWFSGSVKFVASILALACVALFALMASGAGLPLLLQGFQSYADAIARYGWAGIYMVWFKSFLEVRHWLVNFPVGLLFGSAVVLLRDARKNAPSTQLLEAKFPNRKRTAPLVRIRRWWVMRHAHVNGSITLGTDHATGVRVSILLMDMLRHMLCVGTTGSGKTNTIRVILLAWLQHGFPAIFVCGKGDVELAAENCSLAEALGVETYLFDATNPDHSCVYNPVSHGDATSRANRFMQMGDHLEPFYRKINLGFVQTVFSVLDTARHRIDLIQVSKHLDTKSLLAALRRKNLQNRQNAQLLANQVTEQRHNEQHIAGLRADLRNLARSSLSKLFDTRDPKRRVIELAKARASGAYVHFVLPALAYPDWTRQLGRLIVEDIKATASANDRPWLVLLDEAHAFAAENLIPLASMGRGYNLALLVSTQSYAQLQNLSVTGPSAASADALLGSINLHVVHSLNAPSDAELAAALIGTVTDLEVTSQTEHDTPNSLGSLRAVRSYQQHPDRLKRLPRGEAVLVNKVSDRVSHVKIRKI